MNESLRDQHAKTALLLNDISDSNLPNHANSGTKEVCVPAVFQYFGREPFFSDYLLVRATAPGTSPRKFCLVHPYQTSALEVVAESVSACGRANSVLARRKAVS